VQLLVNVISILQSAEDWDYKEKIEKHGSQRDYSSGFGGKYGIQVDRQDKSAVGWDHVEKLEKHESQKGKVALVTSLIFCNPMFKIGIIN
jgi:hypothetical protein